MDSRLGYDCEIILNPIFNKEESSAINIPSPTPEKLSDSIIETIDAGARIINLSLGLSISPLVVYDRLQQANDYALRKGVIIVAAAGNQGIIGNTPILSHQWLIPGTACDKNGRLDAMSNFGPSIGSRRLMAPGVNVNSTYLGGIYSHEWY